MTVVIDPVSVVIDLGCYTHPAYPEHESTVKLIERFAPLLYIGLDPYPDMPENSNDYVGRTVVELRRQAAWIYNGEVLYDPRPHYPLSAAVGWGRRYAVCVDVAELVTEEPGPLVVKLDVEGAEYALVDHLIGSGADALISLLLVEWHPPPLGPNNWETKRDRLLERLAPTCVPEAW